jgi:hypothetical protein
LYSWYGLSDVGYRHTEGMDREREYQNKNDCQNGNNEEKTKTTEKMDYLG